MICVLQERFADNTTFTFFDRDWQRVPLYHGPANKDYIKKPDTFDEMLRLADALSENIPYIRIDFREAGGKAYFAETEFHFGFGGFGKISPDEWNRTLGDWVVLPGLKLKETANSS